ncbi:hypothetical protein AGMMS50262_13980 [Bacteroidia bacterium]|nr:hypothetical protein AGMMS50262_13980 [Bacteroidia bacterium]
MIERQVKKICKEQGITLQELANRLGINRVNLSVSINGNPTLAKMTKIADALGVTVSDLLPIPLEYHVRGYVELNNQMIRIKGADDLRKILEKIDREKYQSIDTISKKRYLTKDCILVDYPASEYNALSNKIHGFQLEINGIKTHSVETLYHALKFPRYSADIDLQALTLNASDTTTLKKQIAPYSKFPYMRLDWDEIKVDVMEWCMRVKFAQHFEDLKPLLQKSQTKTLVKYSTTNDFWGACPVKSNPSCLMGTNVLGQILMKIRNDYQYRPKDILVVKPLKIKDFTIYGRSIETIDTRLYYNV